MAITDEEYANAIADELCIEAGGNLAKLDLTRAMITQKRHPFEAVPDQAARDLLIQCGKCRATDGYRASKFRKGVRFAIGRKRLNW